MEHFLYYEHCVEVGYVFLDGNMSDRNSTEDREKTSLSKSTTIFLYIFIPLITSVIVLGNVIVILAFIVDKRLRNQSNFFLLNLAICDFLIGAFCIPVSASFIITGTWTLGDFLCKVWLIADNLMCTASVFNIVLISYDRFLSITLAVTYRYQQNNHRQTVVKMGTVWVLSFLLYSPAIIIWDYVYGESNIPEGQCLAGYYYNWHFLLGASTFDFILPLISISFFNISIYWNIKLRTRKRSPVLSTHMNLPHDIRASIDMAVVSNNLGKRENKSQTQNKVLEASVNFQSTSSESGNSSNHAAKLSRDKKVAKSLSVLVCVFVFCWAPYTFLQTIRAACHDECVDSYWNQVTSWLLWINSSVNPIIYPLCHKNFRDAFVKLSQMCRFKLMTFNKH
ncbi:histamine H3 receptor-like [Aquarana catesbeiana]|uniref:histamine H3 receptor-like n=1 Tax=Aquarana catesbeiana TaxID=8400 RepID=UPI003CC9B85A